MQDPTSTPASKTLHPNSSALPERTETLLGGGELEMRIAADGTWFYQNSPIRRQSLVKLFASVLRREDDGSYWFVTPVERGRVEVEDVPFLAVEMQQSGAGRQQLIRFRTNLDEWVELDREHPLRLEEEADSGSPRPYIVVRDGLEARLTRSVFYHLVELAVPKGEGKEEQIGVWSKGTFFSLSNA